MDKSTITNAADRARRRQSADTRRIWVYMFLIVVLSGIVFSNLGKDAPLEDAKPYEYPDEPVIREVLAKTDATKLAGVRDTSRIDRSTLEPEAFRHLLIEAGKLVYGDLDQLGIEKGNWDELTESPQDNRGAPVWALGELQWIELVEGIFPTHWRGELTDEDGAPWNFACVVEPSELEPGDIVRISGFHMKHYSGLRPDRSFVSGPFVIGEELVESSWRIEPVTSLPSDELEELRDYSLEAATRPLEEPLFFKLISYVDNTDVESFFPPEHAMEDYETEPAKLMQNSSLFRGKPVRVYGTLFHKQKMPLGPRGENPLGIPFAWHVWIDNAFGGMSLAVSLEEPVGLEKGDIVYADGLFYRRWAFENAINRPVMAAAVVTKRFEKHVPRPDTLTPMIRNGIIALAAICGLLLFIGSMRDRKTSAEHRTRRMRLHRKNVARPGMLHRKGDKPASTIPSGSEPAPEGGA